jgi:hypothetical protein
VDRNVFDWRELELVILFLRSSAVGVAISVKREFVGELAGRPGSVDDEDPATRLVKTDQQVRFVVN